MNGSACTVPVPYIAMAARSAVRVQLYGNSRYHYSGPVQLYRLYLVLSTIYLYHVSSPHRSLDRRRATGEYDLRCRRGVQQSFPNDQRPTRSTLSDNGQRHEQLDGAPRPADHSGSSLRCGRRRMRALRHLHVLRFWQELWRRARTKEEEKEKAAGIFAPQPVAAAAPPGGHEDSDDGQRNSLAGRGAAAKQRRLGRLVNSGSSGGSSYCTAASCRGPQQAVATHGAQRKCAAQARNRLW